MGKHQPGQTSLWHRLKGNHFVVTSAVGAVLIAGGTAGAAVVGHSETAPDSAGAPPASTSAPQQLAEPAPADEQRQAANQREQATESAQQAFDGTVAPQEKQESQDSDQQRSPTGEGGNCEASNYSEPQPTANGETFDPSAMTAAHKELPFDTMVEVTNPTNDKSVTVRINDRGPFVDGRCLDLSTASFEQVASANQGVVDVEWQVVE